MGANFHIITGDKNAIRNINRAVEKAAYTKDLVLQPLASASAVMGSEDGSEVLPSWILVGHHRPRCFMKEY